jgi:hypothetical protein
MLANRRRLSRAWFGQPRRWVEAICELLGGVAWKIARKRVDSEYGYEKLLCLNEARAIGRRMRLGDQSGHQVGQKYRSVLSLTLADLGRVCESILHAAPDMDWKLYGLGVAGR